MDLNYAESKIAWAKFGHVMHFYVIGKEGICIGSGCNIILINLATMEENLLTCNDKVNGEGIDRFIGHRNLNIFAYSEASSSPRIFIRSFPDASIIHILVDGPERGYLCLVFSEADYFFGLGKYPNFELIVWNWRTTEKIASANTSISCRSQMIKCNHNYCMPICIAHIGLLDADAISLWDILVCGKRCVMTEHPLKYRAARKHIPGTKRIEPPYFTNGFWTADGGFFVSNSEGCIFMVSSDYYLDEIINNDSIVRGPTYLCWFNGGIIVSGPDKRFRHYKKSGTWSLNYILETDIYYKKLVSTSKDYFLGLTVDHNVRIYKPASQTFEPILRHQNGFSDVCMVYPQGKFVVTLAHQKEISVWEIATGDRIDTLSLSGKALSITENPEFPYVAVGYEHGLLELYSIYDPTDITLMASFLLTSRPITKIYFTEIARLIVAADMNTGQFFVIEGTPGSKMQVIATVEANYQIADFILVASKTCLRLFAIYVTSKRYIAGNKLVRFCIVSGHANAAAREYSLENPDEMFTKLYATKKANRDRVFYAIPFSRKFVYEIETKRGDFDAKIINQHPLGHHMRKIRMNIDKHSIISYAFDGLVIVHGPQFEENKFVIMPHHRIFAGIKKAYIDPLNRYIVSFGRDGTFLCNKLAVEEENKELEDQLNEIMTSARFEMLFKSKTEGYCPKGELEGKTWLEAERLKNIHIERKQCEAKRAAILEKFVIIQAEVRRLLTENLEGPENELLNIQDFNMDMRLKDKMIFESRELCKRTKAYLEELIVQQDKVTQWIKKYCWDNMEVHGKAIWAIFGNFDVQNYVLLPEDGERNELVQCIEEFRSIENFLSNEDSFEPWIPISEDELTTKLDIIPAISNKEYVEATSASYDMDDDDDVDDITNVKVDEETMTAFAGSITHMFISVDRGQYNQYQLQTFQQAGFQTILSQRETKKLKEFMNKEFENLMSQKVREMNTVMERNARLRYILSELNHFNNDKYQVMVNDAEWKQEEDSELILKVDPMEVGITPYISPSEQAILDAKAAEEERIRLLLLADDFKERALIVMMNGVLEIRWEDELRKEVPIPKCMIEKEPENFIIEDLQAIKEYEEKCKFLCSERERYRNILEAEYAKLGNSLRESVKRFNGRLSDLMLLKIKVDTAVEQENLKVNRLLLNNLKRVKLNQRENNILKELERNERKIDNLHRTIHGLNESLGELKNHFDMIAGKDKLIEKAFRRDFIEVSPVLQDLTNKQYKKRPKTNVRSITSVAILYELAKCMITRQRSVILNQDAIDFLKAMDTLDLFVGIPNIIDENTYSNVCRHRRIKIESEIKTKAINMEISESETTLSLMHKSLVQAKEYQTKLNHDLNETRARKTLTAHDIELQVVLREGYVEIPINGRISDFDDTIMVSRKEVEEINRIIVNGGNRKLKAMRDNMNFRRGILQMEWEHARLKMRIEDFHNYLSDIHSVKVTKEIQSFLKARARGDSPDKTLTFEQEVDMVKRSFERVINERKALVKDLQRKINVVKKDNRRLNGTISDVNVDVCEYKLEVDHDLEKKENNIIKLRMATLLNRSKLVKKIQENHNEILVLQTELELLRLRTYPTLKFKLCE